MRRVILFALLQLMTVATFAYDFKSNGICYNVIADGMVEVTSNPDNSYSGDSPDNSYSGDIYIPSTVMSDSVLYHVTAIGNEAFADCESLSSINIPSGVTSIGIGSFVGCSSLTSLVLPDGLTSIGISAFVACTNLTSINIPSGVTSIEGSVFAQCSSLTSIVLPDGVTSIGDYAFYGCSALTSIVLPAGITSIGEEAFAECFALADVTNLADTPQQITEDVFSNYDATLHVNNGLKQLYASAPVWRYFYQIIDDANGDPTPAELPDNFFYDGLYYNKVSETTVEVAPVPEGVEKYSGEIVVPERAIYEGIEAEVVGIGESAFYDCHDLASVVLPNSVTTIGKWAFWHCWNLASINIPLGVERIEDNAFYHCTTLTSLVLPESITSIGYGAFVECYYLSSINIPQGVTDIEGYAFQDCSSLTTMVLPSTVTYIGACAFSGCKSLESINIPSGVERIEVGTFDVCTSLTSMVLPEGVNYIYRDAFGGCTSLASIVLPSTVTYIEGSAFRNCSALIDVTNLSETPIGITESVFASYDATLHVKKGLQTIYQQAPVWQNFHQIIDDATGDPVVIVELEDPGTLEEEILYPDVVESLTITGPINGTDVNFIRTKLPELRFLDIQGAWVVAGGSAYHSTYTEEPLYTSDYTIGDYMFSEMPRLHELMLCSNTNNIGKGIIESSVGLSRIEIPEQVTSVAVGALNGISHVMVLWNADNAEANADVSDNPNVIIYATENYHGDAMRENLVKGDMAEKLVLHDGYDLGIPQPFWAKHAEYIRTFTKQTQMGISAGWETIVLPFDVTNFVSEKQGRVAPFGSEEATDKHFYLACLANNGFEMTSEMQANIPYIISMPNSPVYADQYNIDGRVMFYAEASSGIYVSATEEAAEGYGPAFNLIPSYESMPAAPKIYVLNDEEYDGMLPGSVFVPNKDVEAFRPYVKDITGYAPAYIPVFEGDVTAIMPIFDVKPSHTDDAVYDLMGIRQNPNHLQKGKVYIVKGSKKVLKRL